MPTSAQITATIARARPALTASMLDTCTIRRPATTGDLNEITGLYETTAGTLIYSGACRLDVSPGGSDPASRDDQTITTTTYTLLTPYDTEEVQVGDVVAITASDDPDSATHSWRVVRVLTGTFRTHQEYVLEEVSTDA